MKKPVVDYREFRFSRLNTPQFAHLKFALLGWLFYNTAHGDIYTISGYDYIIVRSYDNATQINESNVLNYKELFEPVISDFITLAKDLLRSFRRRFTVPLEEAETVCNRIIVLDKGKIKADGDLQTLLKQIKAKTIAEAFRKLTAKENTDE